MANWNKLNASFELIRIQVKSESCKETRYQITVSTTMDEMLTPVNDITSCIQLLSGFMGTAVDDVQDGPMSLWEAIKGLCLATKRVQVVSKGNCIYLNQLSLSLLD
jgi:hypothetical protein